MDGCMDRCMDGRMECKLTCPTSHFVLGVFFFLCVLFTPPSHSTITQPLSLLWFCSSCTSTPNCSHSYMALARAELLFCKIPEGRDNLNACYPADWASYSNVTQTEVTPSRLSFAHFLYALIIKYHPENYVLENFSPRQLPGVNHVFTFMVQKCICSPSHMESKICILTHAHFMIFHEPAGCQSSVERNTLSHVS